MDYELSILLIKLYLGFGGERLSSIDVFPVLFMRLKVYGHPSSMVKYARRALRGYCAELSELRAMHGRPIIVRSFL